MSLTMLSSFLLLGLATVSTVRRRRCLQDRGGRQVEWSITDHPGCWFWGSGEIFVGSSSIDAMEPASAVVSFWRASGVPPLHYPVRTRKNPRTSPAATSPSPLPLLNVLLGMRRFGVLGTWWDFSKGCNGCRSSSFSLSFPCKHLSLFSFSVFPLGLVVLRSQRAWYIMLLLY
jgi:hypothetical protein